MSDAPRRGELTLEDIDGERFLGLLGASSNSSETGGRISSQFEKGLRAGDPDVGAFGLSACGRLVGGLSWGTIGLPRFPGSVSGRLDTVVSVPDVRGQGVGALVMSHFVVKLASTFGEKLRHLSTVALHPAVGACVAGFGFARAESGEVPLFQTSLEDEKVRLNVIQKATHERNQRLSRLRAQCIDCQRKPWVRPWCRGDS